MHPYTVIETNRPSTRPLKRPPRLLKLTDEALSAIYNAETLKHSTGGLKRVDLHPLVSVATDTIQPSLEEDQLMDELLSAIYSAETLKISTEGLKQVVVQEETAGSRKQYLLRDLGAMAVLVLITVIWGGSVLPLDFAIMHTGVFTFQTMRFSLAALALGLLYHRRLRRLTRQDVFIGILTGCILFCFYATQTVGLLYTTISMTGILNGVYVPIVPLLSIMLLRQWPTRGAWIGIVLSFCGLVLLSLNDHFALSFGLGEILLLVSALAYALYIVLISKFAPQVDPIALSWMQMVWMALLSLISMPIAREPLVMPPGSVWLAALFMALVPTAFCMAVMNRVQPLVSSVNATLCYALEPVWVAVVGYFAGDRMGARAWIGCVCILVSIVIGSVSAIKKET